MYRLLSERARVQLLAMISQRESCPLSGCWLTGQGRARWKSWHGNQEPVEGHFYLWKSLGIRLACTNDLDSHTLGRLRRLYRRGLFGRLRRRMLSRWANSLKSQRSSLAHQLHRGICQRIMVLELQSHWLRNCPAEERPQAEIDLRESITLLNTEFADFFQEQMNVSSSSGEVGWPPGSSQPTLQLFCQELFRMARGIDRGLRIEPKDHQMTLHFACGGEQRTGLTPLLQGLRWAGLEVTHATDRLTLQFS